MKLYLIYYVVISLDGFIVCFDGSVDWFDCFVEGGNDYGYNGFYQGIDGLLMGCGIYDIVCGFGDWLYLGKFCQVFICNFWESVVEGVELCYDMFQEGFVCFGEQGCWWVWLVGGGSFVGSCLVVGLFDEVIVSVILQLFGVGILLFVGGCEWCL